MEKRRGNQRGQINDTSASFAEQLEVWRKAAKADTARDEISGLISTVGRFSRAADAIAKRICRYLPQYTLHDDQHAANVLWFMEQLVGSDIPKMGPLECALAILAAHTHDLGMVPDEKENDLIDHVLADSVCDESDPQVVAIRGFLGGHELSERLTSLRGKTGQAEKAFRMLAGKIKVDYLRKTHYEEAGSGAWRRVERWLKKIGTSENWSFQYHGTDFTPHLGLLCLSHGQSIHWLPERMSTGAGRVFDREDLAYCQKVSGTGCGGQPEYVNWARLGWLLRLADIMDLDASRAPKVVFDHLGITDGTSRIEWFKHLSVPDRPAFGPEGGDLAYVCPKSPNPAIEKALRQTTDWINSELTSVREQQERQKHRDQRWQLHLPGKAKLDIQSREGGYLYEDLEFILSRDAVMELLMGTALYDDPALAIRELVQNGLDALHLRDLRNGLWGRLDPATRKPADLPRPGQALQTGETLAVEVTWGEEGGKAFLRVRDNGIGMTLGDVRRFLTHVGRSYYRSDDYRRERELMKRHGIPCTMISQFGIGFLSVFMLGDHVTVRTRPAAANDDFPNDDLPEDEKERLRFPLRAEIHGPHDLIAIYPDAGTPLSPCGTEVTVWLHKTVRLVSWNRPAIIASLRREHAGSEETETDGDVVIRKLDPAHTVGQHIVWPQYPVRCMPSGANPSDALVVDDDFHFRELWPVDQERLRAQAAEWGFTAAQLGDTSWSLCDWEDNGPDGTGSRIRVAVVMPGGCKAKPADWATIPEETPGLLPQSVRNALVHSDTGTRTRFLNHGVHLANWNSICEWLGARASVGSFLWVDLRGPAAPRLRADRSGAVKYQSKDNAKAASAVFTRWETAFASGPKSTAWRWLLHTITSPGLYDALTRRSSNQEVVRLDHPLLHKEMLVQELNSNRRVNGNFEYPFFRVRDLDIVFARACVGDRELGRALTRDRDFARDRARALDFVRAHDRDLDCDLDLALAFALAFDLYSDLLCHDLHLDHTRFCALLKDVAYIPAPTANMWRLWLLSLCYWPSMERAFAPMALAGAEGSLGDCHLRGPLIVARLPVEEPSWLQPYDLVAPLLGLPLHALAAQSNTWRENVAIYALCALPFLMSKNLYLTGAKIELLRVLNVPDVMLLMPGELVIHGEFKEFDREKWHSCSASALWTVEGNQVLYADGVHTKESIRQVGRPFAEWAEKSKLPKERLGAKSVGGKSR